MTRPASWSVAPSCRSRSSVASAPPNDAGLLGATATLFDPATALKYYAPDGKVPSFGITAASGVSADQLRDRLAAALPNTTNVLTGTQLADETKKNLDNGILKIFRIFFLVFAFIAVFVGAFVILNTFSMLVAQRTRELALLRALGASRRQVTRSVLIEAVHRRCVLEPRRSGCWGRSSPVG